MTLRELLRSSIAALLAIWLKWNDAPLDVVITSACIGILLVSPSDDAERAG